MDTTNMTKKIFASILVLLICGYSMKDFENGAKVIMAILISGASFYAAWYLNSTLSREIIIKQLRTQINTYQPGAWTRRDVGKDFMRPDKIRLGVFGVESSGKSSLLNSLLFAYTGVWKVVFAEGQIYSQGGESIFRDPVTLTDHVTLLDNRGTRDLSKAQVSEVMAQILGKRGLNPEEKRKGLKIDCPIFVFKYSTTTGIDQCKPFLRKVITEVKQTFGSHPIIVLTFAADMADRKYVMEDITVEGIDEQNVFFFENYTLENHEAENQRHLDLLEFLRTCIQRADDNIAFTWLRESEQKSKCCVM